MKVEYDTSLPFAVKEADTLAKKPATLGKGSNVMRTQAQKGENFDAGVKVVACENTMRGQKLAKDDMLSRIGYVDAGVVEIMRRQQEHWTYLRP